MAEDVIPADQDNQCKQAESPRLTDPANNRDPRSGDHKGLVEVEDSENSVDTLDQVIDQLVPSLINVGHKAAQSSLNSEERESLFREAQVLESSGDKMKALSLYLQSLDSLTGNSIFSSFPKCLRSVANLYYDREDYEQAINFIQAEKLFYEAALIDNCTIQKKLEDTAQQGKDRRYTSDKGIVKGDSADAIKANEYESLALFCKEKEHCQLALTYATKACQLRRDLYGSDHPLTERSAKLISDLFTESGKNEYSDSLSEYDNVQLDDSLISSKQQHTASILKNSLSPLSSPSTPPSHTNQAQSPSSEVKKRVRFASTTQVTQIEAVGNGLPVNRRALPGSVLSLRSGRSGLSSGDNTLSFLCQLLILVSSILVAGVLGVLMLMVTCRYVRDPNCVTLDQWLTRIDNWTRFYYFKWTSSSRQIVG